MNATLHVPVLAASAVMALLVCGTCPMTFAGDAGDSADMAVILNSSNFLNAHPDMRWRKLGIDALEAGRNEQARMYFLRAARYADKLAQAAYAEMLWNGEGGAQDRPLAYAWMDLAAQRGSRELLLRREYYWSQLDDAERARARDVGQAVYAEYGDKVAKPRQEREMRNGQRQTTGSRTGMAGNGKVCLTIDQGAFSDGGPERGTLLGGGCGRVVDPETYYAPRLWEPADYWAWQNQLVEQAMHDAKAPLHPRIDVGPIQPVDSAKDDGEPRP